ncbi:tetratricopeptide repeat protein [Microseira sp. BLCC-F43]|jgi:tetratricopeptide (TPR) repeat protein|uniref:tetratricopeptide repeat protein n=1 Tax=Microseira sp. BLCC-F43 TaxID=3153602 RepID=UPI0035BB1DED
MNIQDFKESLEKLDALHQQQDYESALKLVQDLLADFPYSVELLIKYAKLIQLIDKDDLANFPSLNEAREKLEISHLIDPKSIEACIELGNFEYAINDSASEAIRYFNAGEEIAKSGLKAAMIGQIKCYADLGDISQAKEILRKAKEFFPDDSELGILAFELEDE